jgi:hypothetical protein
VSIGQPGKRAGGDPIGGRGPIAALNALIADIDKARNRGEDIGLREFDKTVRENQMRAWRHHWLYNCLGPRSGNMMQAEISPYDWFGDPALPHEPAVEQVANSFHPTCSCGFRALLTSDTEEGALRRARVHADVSTPRPDGRYVLTAYDGPACLNHEIEVRLYCRECRGPSLMEISGPPDEHQDEIATVVREHDRDHHGAPR